MAIGLKLKTAIVSIIREALIAELPTVSGKDALRVREHQVRDLIEKYKNFPDKHLVPGEAIREGALVLVVEEWWFEPRERWYFIGFGGELPVEYSGRQFHIVSLNRFKNLGVGQSFQTTEGRHGEEQTLNHKIVYVI